MLQQPYEQFMLSRFSRRVPVNDGDDTISTSVSAIRFVDVANRFCLCLSFHILALH